MKRGGVIFHGYGSVSDKAMKHLLRDHYLQRKPPMQDTFEWRGGPRGDGPGSAYGVPGISVC